MLKYFIINQKEYPVEDVLNGKIKTDYPISYLKTISEARKWTGVLHVTDLLNGARETYLKYTRDYAVDPADRAFIVLGIGSHAKMNDGMGRNVIDVNGIKLSGEADYIEGDTLWDYKIAGSYKVASTIGLRTRDTIIKDAFGNPEVYKSGKKAGQVKTKKEIYLDPSGGDIEDYKLQLNMYRYIYSKKRVININHLKIFFIVRDGGTIAATSRGVTKTTYTVDIPLMEYDEIENWIISRGTELYLALTNYFEKGIDNIPEMCTAKETWNGRKCESYCPVRAICKEKSNDVL